jgi:ferredoxin
MGAGLCMMYAPDTFDQDADTKVMLKDGTADSLDLVRVAIESCPTRALTLIERTNGSKPPGPHTHFDGYAAEP